MAVQVTSEPSSVSVDTNVVEVSINELLQQAELAQQGTAGLTASATQAEDTGSTGAQPGHTVDAAAQAVSSDDGRQPPRRSVQWQQEAAMMASANQERHPATVQPAFQPANSISYCASV